MNTILFQKIYNLCNSLAKITEEFPKRDRYGLGLKIENNCLALMELIITGEQVPPVLKDRALLEASVKAEMLKIMLRFSIERHILKEVKYFFLSSQLIEIGKMIGGWRKSLRR